MRVHLTVFFRTLTEHFRKGTDEIGTVLIADGLADGCDFLLAVFQKLACLIQAEGFDIPVSRLKIRER